MTTLRCLCVAVVAAALAAPAARTQEPAKPGPEHEILKKYEGNWDAKFKMMGQETKATAVYKMDLGGLWLSSTFEGEIFGTKFTGKGMDTYDAGRKKYVGLWCDSMSTSPLVLEGTYDAAKKTMTMAGEGPGASGKTEKYKSVSEWKDDDTILFGMYMGDAKEPAFSIEYKRKK